MRHSKDYKERLFVSSEQSLTLGSQLLVDLCIVSQTTKVVVLLSVSDDRLVVTPLLDEEHLNNLVFKHHVTYIQKSFLLTFCKARGCNLKDTLHEAAGLVFITPRNRDER